MMKRSFYPVLLVVLCQILAIKSGNIEHVIVLMMENRSLDHMLGFLKLQNPKVDGCLPNQEGCSNPVDPLDPASETVTVDNNAVFQQTSPSHSIHGTTKQIFGSGDETKPDMKGFIKSYTGEEGNIEGGKGIMKCFSPEHIPVMANLSMEFGFFDGWFASVPGPTEVNRCYAASATSHGMGTNDAKTMVIGQPQKTMFRQLQEMGLDFRVYYDIVPTVLQFKDMRHYEVRHKYRKLSAIYEDLANGDMPQFSWLEPNYFDELTRVANDDHPDHDVSAGQRLIKSLYDAIRASPLWEKTAFIITYDEHGGFFDHVPPPMNVPNPDGLNATDDPFDFTRLGVRVPTLVISPWVPKGSVFHAPERDGQYEHSSIVRTVVHGIFEPAEGHHKQPFLNKRDEWCAGFEWIFKLRDTPRSDCPMTTPDAPSHKEMFPDSLPALDGSGPLNDLQKDLLYLVAGATADFSFEHKNITAWTEQEGANYCRERLDKYFA